MKDVFDLVPELTIEEAEQWAEEAINPYLEKYLKERIEIQKRVEE